jgi:transcriptional regulator with XRE-family HTH domain
VLATVIQTCYPVPVMKVPQVGRFIREQRSAAKMSLRKLAALAGVSNPYLSQIERGLRRPSAEILNAIAKGLRISSETLYVQAGILDDRRDPADLMSAILADRGLTEQQKQVLIQIYQSFREETDRRRQARRSRKAAAETTTEATELGGRVESAG